MRFVCVTLGFHPDLVGGAWRVAAEQCAGLAARGHSVDVVTSNPGNNLPEVEPRQGFRLHRYPATEGSFLARWRAANRAAAALIRERLAAEASPPLVIQHHAYLGPALRAVRTPVLHCFHGPWAEEYRFATRAGGAGLAQRTLQRLIPAFLHHVEARALRQARRIVVLSRHFRDGLARWHGTRLAPVEIVPGGVDLQRFRPPEQRAEHRAAWHLDGDETLFVAIRRLDPRMGLDVLIEAFARIAPDFPRARLWLTGRGPAEDSLRAQIDRLGLQDPVRLLGFLPDDDVPRLLGAADFAIVPSLDLEGFGLATVEALACGTPVLGSRAAATPEILEPLSRELLFEAGSVTALAERMRVALTRPDRLPSRERCAAFARERYAWSAQVEACERAARELGDAPRNA